MGKKVRNMSWSELTGWLGDSQPGTIVHSETSAELERRKHFWMVIATFAAVAVAIVGIANLFLH